MTDFRLGVIYLGVVRCEGNRSSRERLVQVRESIYSGNEGIGDMGFICSNVTKFMRNGYCGVCVGSIADRYKRQSIRVFRRVKEE